MMMKLPTFRSFFETMRIEWRNLTPCFVFLPERENKNNSLFRVRIGTYNRRIYRRSLCAYLYNYNLNIVLSIVSK